MHPERAMLAELTFNFNTEFIKYVVIGVSFPFWSPFIKALWEDFNDALRDEGGLLGYAPSRQKLDELNRERGDYRSVLVNEPFHNTTAQERSPYRRPGVRAKSLGALGSGGTRGVMQRKPKAAARLPAMGPPAKPAARMGRKVAGLGYASRTEAKPSAFGAKPSGFGAASPGRAAAGFGGKDGNGRKSAGRGQRPGFR